MTPLLALLLAAVPDAPPNLDFAEGKLTHWQGEGFQLVEGSRLSSADRDGTGRRALLHRTFVVPPGAGTLHFTAHASHADDRLNVFLEAAERELVPKRVRTATGFEKSPRLHVADQGRSREYHWSIADRVGETLRIIILDHTDEPGRHVVCSGFRLEAVDEFETREFVQHMNALVRQHRIGPMETPYRSKHFLAVSNTDEKFVVDQLDRCELMHQLFLNHFRVKGFKLKKPATRLMVAIFTDQEGVEAYVGGRMPGAVTGFYHPASNRLIVYDFGRNRDLVRDKLRVEDHSRRLSDRDRVHLLGRVYREADEIRADTNIATIMHEAAHLMSFNTGLLNRDGDLPVWAIEGLATYCEATEGGFWKGIGVVNPERIKALRRGEKGMGKYLPLRTLVENDLWLHTPGVSSAKALMGYAQSWALVRMLMEEQPKSFKRYLELIRDRRTPDHRLRDFAEAFGSDLGKMEQRHRDYIKRLAN